MILYKSLYPSITLEFNIAPNTQIGRIVIPNKVYDHENVYGIEEGKYSRSGEFIENMVTDNVIEFCKRWFKLAGVQEFLEDIDEFYEDRNLGRFSNLVNAGFKEQPLIPVANTIETPVLFSGSKVETPLLFYNDRPQELTFINLRKKASQKQCS